MKNLFKQIIKFGLVGGLCFVIDFAITLVVSIPLRAIGMATDSAAVVAAFFGFLVSVIVNYLLSMKYVFERKDDMDRKQEFIIFVILSVIGLLINELIIKGSMVAARAWVQSLYESQPTLITAGAKVVATAVVMVYNFISRKMFLEKKND